MTASLTIVVPGVAQPKDRARGAGAGRPHTTQRTRSAEEWLRAYTMEQIGAPCLTDALALVVSITLPVPPSWSAKRRSEALAGHAWPTGRPDADNYLKLVCDALNGVAWRDDSQIVDARVVKAYGAEPRTVIVISAIRQENIMPSSHAADA